MKTINLIAVMIFAAMLSISATVKADSAIQAKCSSNNCCQSSCCNDTAECCK